VLLVLLDSHGPPPWTRRLGRDGRRQRPLGGVRHFIDAHAMPAQRRHRRSATRRPGWPPQSAPQTLRDRNNCHGAHDPNARHQTTNSNLNLDAAAQSLPVGPLRAARSRRIVAARIVARPVIELEDNERGALAQTPPRSRPPRRLSRHSRFPIGPGREVRPRMVTNCSFAFVEEAANVVLVGPTAWAKPCC